VEKQRSDAALLTYERFRHLRGNPEETLEAEFPIIHLIEDICSALNRIRTNCATALRDERSSPELRERAVEPMRVTEDLLVYLADDQTLRRREEWDRIAVEVQRKLETFERISDRTTYLSVRESFASLIQLS
jgi:hypothetical protein